MTLGDLLQKYFKERQKTCENKARHQNFHLCNNQEEKNNVWSNTYNDIKLNDNNNQLTLVSLPQISKRVSQSSRIIQLPDGTIQIETIRKDSKGNEEKSITYQKNGKNFTKVFRKDASGVETVEERVTNADDVNDIIPFHFNDKLIPSFSHPRNHSDNDYHYWFKKFFKPKENWKNETIPFDLNPDIDEQINNMLKGFSNGTFFDNFFENRKHSPSDEHDFFNSSPNEDFSKMTDFAFGEDVRNFLKNFEKNGSLAQKNFNKNNKFKRQIEGAMKSFNQTKSASLFDHFAERAFLELPDEKTPFDKFIEPDEEKQQKLSSLKKETEELVKKLDQAFPDSLNTENKDFVYSDIDQSKNNDNLSFMVPKQPEINTNVTDFVDALRETFGPNSVNYATIQSEMNFGNGRKRIESIKKDANGNSEKTVTYKLGKQIYNIVTITDQYGNQIKKERNTNFSEDELNDFKNQWNKKFHSDFSD